MNKQKDDITNITVGITIFNQERNKVILKKRKTNELFPDKYGLPGGKIKFGESIEVAIKRELYEETKIIINNTLYVQSYKSEDIYFFVYSAIINENNDSFILLDDIDGLELAPNVSDAIKDSLDFLEKSYCNLNINIIDLTKDIIAKVANNVVSINNKTGWDHFILQQRIGTIGSSIGLSILNNTKEFNSLKEDVYRTLIKSQLPDGGWGVKSSENKFSITESTCNCAIAIFDYIKQDNENIQIAKKWIISNMLDDFSWGCSKNSIQGRVTSTCLAIQTLFKISPSFSLENNINWLLNNQNKDGGWGFTANSPSNLTATSMTISTLIRFIDKNSNQILNAIKWIEKKLERVITNEESEVEYIGDSRFEYKHSTIIYILQALIEQKGINNISPVYLYNNLSSIISNRNLNGFWEHSLTPNHFPIWHTCNILKFFLQLLENAKILNLSYVQEIYCNYKLQMDLVKFLEDHPASHEGSNYNKYY